MSNLTLCQYLSEHVANIIIAAQAFLLCAANVNSPTVLSVRCSPAHIILSALYKWNPHYDRGLWHFLLRCEADFYNILLIFHDK